jgi:hypothetical protein
MEGKARLTTMTLLIASPSGWGGQDDGKDTPSPIRASTGRTALYKTPYNSGDR